MALLAAAIHTPSSNELSLCVTGLLSGKVVLCWALVSCLSVLCHPEPWGDEQISSLMLCNIRHRGFTPFLSLSGLRELVMDREAWRAVIHGVAKSRTWLSGWTELNWLIPLKDHKDPNVNWLIPLKDPNVSSSSPFLFVQCINLLFSPLLSPGILPGLCILISWIQSPLGKFNPLVFGKFSNACTICSFSFIQQQVYFAIAQVF